MLGPLRVTVDERPIHLPGRQRTVFAMLALNPNRVVSIDRLIDGLWGEDPPVTAAKTLQTHVFQLRRQLAPDGESPGTAEIATEPNGYCLRVDAASIDVQRFEQQLARARQLLATDPGGARDTLREALALWEGPALADFAYEPFAESEISRLDELHLQAVEELARVQLELGENDAVIGELRRAVVEAPYREQLWASLMIALVRSGRSAEALLAYRDLEMTLSRELDAEPSPELQSLADRIRKGDSSLMAPDAAALPSPSRSAPAVAVALPESPRRRRVQRRHLLLGGAVVAAVGLVVALGVRQLGSTNADAPAALDAAQRDLLERLPLRIRDACQPSPDGESLPRSTASLTCQVDGSDARSVTFDSFADAGIVSLDLRRPRASSTAARPTTAPTHRAAVATGSKARSSAAASSATRTTARAGSSGRTKPTSVAG